MNALLLEALFSKLLNQLHRGDSIHAFNKLLAYLLGIQPKLLQEHINLSHNINQILYQFTLMYGIEALGNLGGQ